MNRFSRIRLASSMLSHSPHPCQSSWRRWGHLAVFIGASRTPLSLPPGTDQSGYSGGYATQILECGRWVSIHCRDCEVLKCETAESTGFDTETAIKSTGLGLTHARAPAVSPSRAFNPLETEGWHHDPRSRSLRFKQPFCMGGGVGIAVSPTCSQGPLPAINGRMLGTDSLEDLAVQPALNGARIPAQNIYVV